MTLPESESGIMKLEEVSPEQPAWMYCGARCNHPVNLHSEVVLLSCFHIICSTECIHKLLAEANEGLEKTNEYKIRCGICHIEIAHEQFKAKMVRGDFFVKKPQIRCELKCEFCVGDAPAVASCKECSSTLCELCAINHPIMRKTHMHKLSYDLSKETEKMVKDQEEKEKEREQQCSTHPSEILKFYCNDCRHYFCDTCEPDHRNHVYIILEKYLAFLEFHYIKAIEWKQKSELCIDELKKKRMAIFDIEKPSGLQAIDLEFDKLINMIEQRRAEAKARFESVVADLVILLDRKLIAAKDIIAYNNQYISAIHYVTNNNLDKFATIIFPWVALRNIQMFRNSYSGFMRMLDDFTEVHNHMCFKHSNEEIMESFFQNFCNLVYANLAPNTETIEQNNGNIVTEANHCVGNFNGENIGAHYVQDTHEVRSSCEDMINALLISKTKFTSLIIPHKSHEPTCGSVEDLRITYLFDEDPSCPPIELIFNTPGIETELPASNFQTASVSPVSSRRLVLLPPIKEVHPQTLACDKKVSTQLVVSPTEIEVAPPAHFEIEQSYQEIVIPAQVEIVPQIYIEIATTHQQENTSAKEMETDSAKQVELNVNEATNSATTFQTDSAAGRETNSAIYFETNPAAGRETNSAIYFETNPAAREETNSTTHFETDPAVNYETDSTTRGETNSSSDYQTDLTTRGETNSSSDYQTDLTTRGETNSSSDYQTDLTTRGETNSTTHFETDSTTRGETNSSSDYQTDPAAREETNSTTHFETDPAVNYETDSTTRGETNSSSDYQTDLTTRGETNSSSDYQTDSTARGETNSSSDYHTDSTARGETNSSSDYHTDSTARGETNSSSYFETDSVAQVETSSNNFETDSVARGETSSNNFETDSVARGEISANNFETDSVARGETSSNNFETDSVARGEISANNFETHSVARGETSANNFETHSVARGETSANNFETDSVARGETSANNCETDSVARGETSANNCGTDSVARGETSANNCETDSVARGETSANNCGTDSVARGETSANNCETDSVARGETSANNFETDSVARGETSANNCKTDSVARGETSANNCETDSVARGETSANNCETDSVARGETSANNCDTDSVARGETSANNCETDSVARGESNSFSYLETDSAARQETNSTTNYETDSAARGDINSAANFKTDSATPRETTSAANFDSAARGETNSATKFGTDSAAREETNSTTHFETDPAVNYETDSTARGETNSSSDYETDSTARGETNSSSDYETDSTARGETNSSSDYQTDLTTRGETNSATKFEIDSAAGGETNSGTNFETNSATKFETDSATKFETDSATKFETDSATKFETDSATKFKTDSAARGETNSGPYFEIDLVAHVETVVKNYFSIPEIDPLASDKIISSKRYIDTRVEAESSATLIDLDLLATDREADSSFTQNEVESLTPKIHLEPTPQQKETKVLSQTILMPFVELEVNIGSTANIKQTQQESHHLPNKGICNGSSLNEVSKDGQANASNCDHLEEYKSLTVYEELCDRENRNEEENSSFLEFTKERAEEAIAALSSLEDSKEPNTEDNLNADQRQDMEAINAFKRKGQEFEEQSEDGPNGAKRLRFTDTDSKFNISWLTERLEKSDIASNINDSQVVNSSQEEKTEITSTQSSDAVVEKPVTDVQVEKFEPHLTRGKRKQITRSLHQQLENKWQEKYNSALQIVPVGSIEIIADKNLDNYPVNSFKGMKLKNGEDSSEDYCAVCLDGGDETIVCCDFCPKVFHLQCHTPALKSVPDEDWRCMFSTTKTMIDAETSLGEESGSENMELVESNKSQFLLACKFVMQCYKVAHIPIARWIFPQAYYDLYGKVPVHLKFIREKLALGKYGAFKSVQEMLLAFKQMFVQAFIYYKNSSTHLEAAELCFKSFIYLIKAYYPKYESMFNDVNTMSNFI